MRDIDADSINKDETGNFYQGSTADVSSTGDHWTLPYTFVTPPVCPYAHCCRSYGVGCHTCKHNLPDYYEPQRYWPHPYEPWTVTYKITCKD